ncbi:glycosyltransferase family 4 protein [bacterium]|nr:glycosyltransferase family 4 protein [bacterium]MBU1651393.1 glycosyltransferase family 4 protein [bacterium]MBU1881321.1 glycosyltransferase family 4 protein [bacterium]
MRIVLLSPTYPLRGGIARYGTYLLRAIQTRHHCLGLSFKRLYPDFLFPGRGQEEKGVIPRSGSAGDRVLHYANPASWRRALQGVKAFNPEAVVIAWWVPFWSIHFTWFARQVQKICPVYYLCHNVLPHERKFFDQKLTRWALKPASGFIVHSEAEQRQLQEWYPASRVLRREHPVYFFDDEMQISKEEARKELGIKGRMLLFFGFIRPYKGLDLALEALAHLGPSYQDLKLWVAGEIWGADDIYRTIIKKYHLDDQVKIESTYLHDHELSLRILASDAVLLPYRTATGSGVLATTYAHGRPVIASQAGSLKNMVIHGQTGLHFETGDSDSLVEAIEELYAGEGPERFIAGVEAAKSNFTWDNIVDAIEELTRHE